MRAALLVTLAVLTGVPAAAVATTSFDTPSRNIGCYVSASGARCDIRSHTWTTPAKPASCDVDYGQGVSVGRSGRGRFVCAGDTALHVGKVLPYGRSVQAGDISCVSARVGVTCRNARTKHGFTLARGSYRLF
jgi:hypothetical protein